MLRVGLSAAGESKVPSPGRVLVEGRNRRAASPPQGLLLSLGVQGHFATVTASGQGGPEGGHTEIPLQNAVRSRVTSFSLLSHIQTGNQSNRRCWSEADV